MVNYFQNLKSFKNRPVDPTPGRLSVFPMFAECWRSDAIRNSGNGDRAGRIKFRRTLAHSVRNVLGSRPDLLISFCKCCRSNPLSRAAAETFPLFRVKASVR